MTRARRSNNSAQPPVSPDTTIYSSTPILTVAVRHRETGRVMRINADQPIDLDVYERINEEKANS